jgi:hypothetical protein
MVNDEEEMAEEADTCSNDSPREKESSSQLSWDRALRGSLGDCKPSDRPPSDDKETEWKEDTDEVGTWPLPFRLMSTTLSLDNGGYVCSTESDCATCPGEGFRPLPIEVKEPKEGSLGGRGGGGGERDFEAGGISMEMSGVDITAPGFWSLLGLEFVGRELPFVKCGDPSSRTQSFKSIKDVFRPK